MYCVAAEELPTEESRESLGEGGVVSHTYIPGNHFRAIHFILCCQMYTFDMSPDSLDAIRIQRPLWHSILRFFF